MFQSLAIGKIVYGIGVFEIKLINNLFSDSNIKHSKIQNLIVLHTVALYNEITAVI